MPDVASPSFAAHREQVQRAIRELCLPRLGGLEPSVADAIRYSLLGEGKAMRAILLIEAYRAAGGTGDAGALGAAVEVVHAYSLVHDDLPCMGDDDMRRGRPTVHRAFGVRAATAAGLAMVPLAVRCAYVAAESLGLSPPVRGAVVRELMRASGAGGMIGGQLLDLAAEGSSLSLSELERVHALKTGALITASVRIGALAARGGPDALAAFERYGAAVGLAFQIADDVLDVTGTTVELGKAAGRDLRLNKSTYPALLGVEGAVARAGSLVEQACDALRPAGLLTPELERLARYVVARRS